VKEAKRRLEEELWTEQRANDAYEAYRARGVDKRGRRLHHNMAKDYAPPATPVGKVNLTDPDSKNLKAPRGYIQGYNAQAVVNENQIVIAAEINTGSSDFGHLGPMVEAAQQELEAAGIVEQPGVIVADAGYWHQQQMEHISGQGIPVLVPPDADKRKGIRPGWDGGPYAFMRAVLETELGKTLYRRRQETVEPVFANTKFNRRFDRFQRRGRAACHSEWRLINATHNLLKLHTALQAA